MSGAERLEILRDLLGDAHRALDLEFGFELWDGSVVPQDLPASALRIVIGRENVVAALLRRPKLDTVIKHGGEPVRVFVAPQGGQPQPRRHALPCARHRPALQNRSAR